MAQGDHGSQVGPLAGGEGRGVLGVSAGEERERGVGPPGDRGAPLIRTHYEQKVS